MRGAERSMRRDQIWRRLSSIGLIVVLMPCAGRSASAQLIGPSDNVPSAYIRALNVANRFLEDWRTGNVGDATELLSRRLRAEIKDNSWFAEYVTGLSNPHHLAYEIIGVQLEKADRYSFHVILYELAATAPSGNRYGSLFELVKQGDEWKIDVLPRSSDNQK